MNTILSNIQRSLMLLIFLMSMATASHAQSPPSEPSEDHLINEDVNIITGLYTRAYSLQGNGVVDYKTARQIVISEYNAYWNTVAHTKEYPLFYWYDANQDGEFDMWVDQKVEGCSCDIVLYEAIDNYGIQ